MSKMPSQKGSRQLPKKILEPCVEDGSSTGKPGLARGDLHLADVLAKKGAVAFRWILAVVAMSAPLVVCPRDMAAANELILRDGRRLVGEFLGFGEDRRLRFVADLEATDLLSEEFILWGRLPDITAPIIVVLADGSLLGASFVTVVDEVVRIRPLQALDVTFPVETLAGILLVPPGDRERRDRLIHEIVAATEQEDHLLLINGDRLSGVVLRIDEKMCLLDISGGTATVGRENVVAVIFHPLLRASLPRRNGLGQKEVTDSPPRIFVGLLDGSLLLCDTGQTLRPAIELQLSLGPVLSVKAGAIVFLQPLGGWGVYLSDLQPIDYEHRPFLGIERLLGRDRTVLGTRLRKGGRVYPKGLGMQSWSRAAFRLNKKFTRFEAVVGLDDLAGDRGCVEFVIRVDGREAFRSGPVRGTDGLRPVAVDVTSAEVLELRVEFSESAHEFDFANWFLARLLF